VPLADTPEAIGAVTDLVRGRLSARLNSLNVTVGRPQAASASGTGPKLNLFLDRVAMDGYLRNTPLDEGQPPPLWMVLHYLLTAFDTNRDSDSVAAHRLLGRGLSALHELNFLRPPVTETALTDNPEPLKITFDEADADLLSKIMQGSEEQYRISAAFRCGRCYRAGRDAVLRAARAFRRAACGAGRGGAAQPGRRARCNRAERFEAGAALALFGIDLAGYTEVWIGDRASGAAESRPAHHHRAARHHALGARLPGVRSAAAARVTRTRCWRTWRRPWPARRVGPLSTQDGGKPAPARHADAQRAAAGWTGGRDLRPSSRRRGAPDAGRRRHGGADLAGGHRERGRRAAARPVPHHLRVNSVQAPTRRR
jgi:hypothetical protein